MNIFRRAVLAWTVALPIWVVLIVMSLANGSFVPSVLAQGQLPTTPSSPPALGVGYGQPPVAAPTKPRVEPQPTKVTVEALPTKEPIPPTHAPTKAPTSVSAILPTKTVMILPTKTAVVRPTKTEWPTQLPTTPSGSPTQSAGYGEMPGSTTTATPSSASASFPAADRVTPPTSQDQTQRATGALQPSQPEVGTSDSGMVSIITGIVFDDANDNGQRDPDEAGLAGVAVSVETAESGATRLADGGHGQPPADSYMVVTDASGVYSLPAIAGATVRVIVPAGWSTRQSESLPLDRARDFPLRAKNSAAIRQPAAITPLAITQSVIDFAPLIALGLGLGAVMAIGFLRVARAVSTSNRTLALLLVRMQRTSEKPITFDGGGQDRATDARVLAMLNQAALDAVGRPLNIERVLSVTAGDRPAVTALGIDGRAAFVVFTPMDDRSFRRAWRTSPEWSVSEVAFAHATAYPLGRLGEALTAGHATAYPLDALNSGLFVADDLAAVHAFLAADLPVSARTLSRTPRWTLFVVPLPRNDLAVHSGWRYRIGRRLRP